MKNKFINNDTENLIDSDFVITPDFIAQDMINYFNPNGLILDPCAGNNAFYKFLPKNSEWNEISRGIDFFLNDTRYDWIIGNPPYSIFKKWMIHSYKIADNIVYLLPTFKVFNALGLIRLYNKLGNIKHIRLYDVGSKIEWARGRPIVAVYWQKNYKGTTDWSCYEEKN